MMSTKFGRSSVAASAEPAKTSDSRTTANGIRRIRMAGVHGWRCCTIGLSSFELSAGVQAVACSGSLKGKVQPEFSI